MKKKTPKNRLFTAAGAGLLFLWVVPVCATANTIPPDWNVVGSWVFDYEVQNGNYNLSMNVTSMDFVTGIFTATMPQSGYAFSDGSVQGSNISFGWGACGPDTFGQINCVSAIWTGTVAADGTLSGALAENNGHGEWYGGWATIAGQATQITPEPGTIVLLSTSLSGLGLIACRRKSSCSEQRADSPDAQSGLLPAQP